MPDIIDIQSNPSTGAYYAGRPLTENKSVSEIFPLYYGFQLTDRISNSNLEDIVIYEFGNPSNTYEIITSGNPNATQFKIVYGSGFCQTSSSNDGVSVTVEYYGRGSNINIDNIQQLVQESLSGVTFTLPQWATGTEYLENTLLHYNGYQVRATQDHFSGSAFDIDNYEIYGLPEIGQYIYYDPNRTTGRAIDLFPELFIILTKDLSDSGEFNNGKLTNQQTITANDQIRYTADIVGSDSPLVGDTIDLINSVRDNGIGTPAIAPATITAGESAGFRYNKYQSHEHADNGQQGTVAGGTGAGSGVTRTFSDITVTNPTSRSGYGTSRDDTFTEANSYSRVFYLRYK